MAQVVRDKRGAILGAVIVLLVVLIARVYVSDATRTLNAQESPSNIRVLLEHLHAEMTEDPDLLIVIGLAVPMVPGESTTFVLPDRFEDDEDKLSRAISEIGEDYVCFDVVKGAVRTIECTPYSNIVRIAYNVH